MSLGDLGGRVGAHPTMGPDSFVFTYIFTEKHPRRRSTPPLTGARPPTGNPRSATGCHKPLTVDLNVFVVKLFNDVCLRSQPYSQLGAELI